MPCSISARHDQQLWRFHAQARGLTLLEELQQHEVPIKSSCLGKGLCRQCRVRIEAGLAPIAATDRKSFSDEQLRQGWRLSCALRPKTNLALHFPQSFVFQKDLRLERPAVSPWWVAIDLGTTGIELAAIDSQGPWAQIKELNRQVSMGADVMTRLEYAQRLGCKALRERMVQQVLSLIEKLQGQTPLPPINEIWLAGNSVMTSFAHELAIDGLAVAPYQPQRTEPASTQIGQWTARCLPLLSSFVGGDLTAGLFLLWQEGLIGERSWVLVDVGTNSEILFWDGQTLFVSSTPAGPAFEGSSISIGMRAELGAILDVERREDQWHLRTVGDDLPRGICGTGLIKVISECRRLNFIGVDGEVLSELGLHLNEELSLSQDDVREFQLAKSAIATGIELVVAHGAQPAAQLFLAGSFGEHLPLESCFELGLLPRLPVRTLGNSSLAGTILWGQASADKREIFMNWLKAHMRPIELALSDDFQAAFVRNMSLAANHSRSMP